MPVGGENGCVLAAVAVLGHRAGGYGVKAVRTEVRRWWGVAVGRGGVAVAVRRDSLRAAWSPCTLPNTLRARREHGATGVLGAAVGRERENCRNEDR